MKKFNEWKQTEEMKKFYEKRTKKHISLVQKYCKKIDEYDKNRFEGIVKKGKEHDQSKYEKIEKDPYIFITWEYKCKAENEKCDISDEMRKKMREASKHHIESNAHHPEYHESPKKMSDLDIAEMVADWCAMSEELDNDPKEWADKNIGSKWKFNKKQKDLIYKLIDRIWS